MVYHSVWPCKKLLWDTQAEPSPGYILGLHRNKTGRLGIVFATQKDPEHCFFTEISTILLPVSTGYPLV